MLVAIDAVATQPRRSADRSVTSLAGLLAPQGGRHCDPVFARRRDSIVGCRMVANGMSWPSARYAEPSDLLARIADLHPELPALESHKHAPKLLPRNLLSIDDEQRHVLILPFVPGDSRAYGLLGNL